MFTTSKTTVKHLEQDSKQLVLNDLDPTLALVCCDILGPHSPAIVAVLREAGITNFHLLDQLTEINIGKLTYTPIGSSTPRPLLLGSRLIFRAFIKWNKHLFVRNCGYLTDEQWRSINPLEFKTYTAKECCGLREATTPTPDQNPSKAIDSSVNLKGSAKRDTSLDISSNDHRPPQPAKGEPIATAEGGKIAKLVTMLADDDPTSVVDNSVPLLHQAAPDGREVTPPAVKVDTTTIADDDPIIMAASEVTICSPTWHDWPKDQVEPFTKERCATENQPESRDIISVRSFIEENGLADHMAYPSRWKSSCFEEFIFSTSTGTMATEMATVKKSACTMKQQSLSESDPTPKYICKDILEIRKIPHTLFSTASRKTELIILVAIIILIIQLSQHEFDGQESAFSLQTTSMMNHQSCLDPTGGETTPSPNTSLAEGETSKTATLTLTPLPINFLTEGKNAKTSTTTTVSLAQAKGETNEATTVQKNTQYDCLLFGQVNICCWHPYSIVNKCTASKKGELRARSHDGNESTLLPIMRKKQNVITQHPADDKTLADAHAIDYVIDYDDQMNIFESTLIYTPTPTIADEDPPLGIATPADPMQIKVATTTLADDDPRHQTVDTLKTQQFITARTTLIIYLPRQQPENGEPATVATHSDTGLIVSKRTVRLTDDVPMTIADLADDVSPADAPATDYEIIVSVVNILYAAACIDAPGKIEDAITKNAKPFLASLTSKLRYAASAVAQQVNAADSEPPVTTVMIATRTDGDPKTSGYIGAPLLFTHAIMSDLTSLGQREYSAGNTPPATNIDTTKLADDDPRMSSMNDNSSIPSWNDWTKKVSHSFTRDLTARQYPPESRDIISVRIFNQENDQVDPMVYLSHHGNCFCFDEPTTTSPGIRINEKVRTDQAQVDKINSAKVRDQNTIHTTQWGVTGDRQGWRRISVTGLMVIYDDVMSTAKESWILAKHLSYWNCVYESLSFSTNCTCQVVKYYYKTPGHIHESRSFWKLTNHYCMSLYVYQIQLLDTYQTQVLPHSHQNPTV
jgi:hypothetical protein